MLNVKKRTLYYIIMALVGAVLLTLSLKGLLDEFWSGIGAGLVVISALRFVQLARYSHSDEYAQKTEVRNHDERNLFMAEKARSHAFYYSILLEGVGVIVARVAGNVELSVTLGYIACAQMMVYWVSYFILKRKY